MEKAKLRELLRNLHQELEQADAVEPESRRLLTEVLEDIREVLDSSQGKAAETSFGERLRKAVVDFENNHPQVAFTVERLVQSLADMGI